MSKKVLTGAMAAMMAAGMVPTTAFAGTNVDALYKAAYEATVKALEVKSQTAINEAREAIAKLPADLDWAVGEFSKQVDSVQHPILVDIVNAIEAAEKNPVQANINAAKKAIPANLPDVWRASYSSAVDVIQQGLQKRLVSAIETAEELKTTEAVAGARLLVNDVLTADDADMKAWAKLMSDRLDAVIVSPIVVTAVTELTTQTITVEFRALEAAVKGATITVVDGNGKIYPVAAKDLVKGETKATFNFVETLLERPTSGIWSVNGYRLNLDEEAYVNELKRLVDIYYGNESDVDYVQKEILKHLKSAALENINDKNIAKYIVSLYNGAYGSVADIQEIIDTVNQEVLTGLTMEQFIKDAHKGTVAQFTETLRKAGFDRVNIENVEWVEAYKKAVTVNFELTSLPVNACHIQVVLDAVNFEKVAKAYDTIEETHKERRSDKIAEVLELAKTYLVDGNAKNDQVKAINIADAVQQVNMAKTEAELKSGLQALKAIDNSVVNYDERVNENIIGYYLNVKLGIHALDLKVTGAAETLASIINQGERNAIVDALAVVETTAATVLAPASHPTVENEVATRKANFLASLENLATVSAKTGKNETYSDTKFDLTAVKEARYVEYAKLINASANGDTVIGTVGVTTSQDANLLVNFVNKTIVSTVLGNASSMNADQLLAALKSDKLGLTNVVDANKDAYKYDVEFILNTIGEEVVEAIGTPDAAIAALEKAINKINTKQEVVFASNYEGVLAGLKKLAGEYTKEYEVFVALGETNQKDIAQLIFGKVNPLTNDAKNKISVTSVVGLINEAIESRRVILLDINKDYVLWDTEGNINTDALNDLIAVLNKVPDFAAISGDVAKVEAASKFVEKRPYNTDGTPKTLTNFTQVMSYTK